MLYKSHFSFLKRVFVHSITAFGGPQGHLGMMIRHFCTDSNFILKDDLMSINTFCQLLPGATSTQTVTLIGFKRGGIFLAGFTLLIWSFPAILLMSLFSLLMHNDHTSLPSVFKYFQPMALGFLLYASLNVLTTLKQYQSWLIFFISVMITFFLFHTPWFFPLVLVVSSLLGYFTVSIVSYKIASTHSRFSWKSIFLFLLIFILAGFLSETARKQDWKYRSAFNLFENMYRFGSTVFGGADVLIPVMYEQYVTRPNTEHIQQFNHGAITLKQDIFLTGAGIVRAIPGPAFSISSFIGGQALSDFGLSYRLMGCFIGAIAIFLPSFLLAVSLFPLWETIQQYVFLQRMLTGIKAGIVGIMIVSTYYLMKDMFSAISHVDLPLLSVSIMTLVITLALLYTQKVSPPIIVLICCFAGYFF